VSHFNLSLVYTVPRLTNDEQLVHEETVGRAYLTREGIDPSNLTVVRSEDPYLLSPTMRIDFDYQIDAPSGVNRSTIGDVDITVPVPNIEVGFLLWDRKLAAAYQNVVRDYSILAYDIEYGDVTLPPGTNLVNYINTARQVLFDTFPTFIDNPI
jgi:hypothetical protein